MSNDAKLGLVVGMGLVLTIGLVFHRRDPSGLPMNGRDTTATPFMPGAPPTPTSTPTPDYGPFTPAAEPPPLPN